MLELCIYVYVNVIQYHGTWYTVHKIIPYVCTVFAFFLLACTPTFLSACIVVTTGVIALSEYSHIARYLWPRGKGGSVHSAFGCLCLCRYGWLSRVWGREALLSFLPGINSPDCSVWRGGGERRKMLFPCGHIMPNEILVHISVCGTCTLSAGIH